MQGCIVKKERQMRWTRTSYTSRIIYERVGRQNDSISRQLQKHRRVSFFLHLKCSNVYDASIISDKEVERKEKREEEKEECYLRLT